MSLTVQQIVLDAKNLAMKLKDSNVVADNLKSEVQNIHRKIDAMKQYDDEVSELNEIAGHKPHGALIASIQQENRHLRDLQQENRELRAALEEQQNALELIMSKYRQQMTRILAESSLDLPSLYNQKYSEIIVEQTLKIQEMSAVMRKAAEIGENDSVKMIELCKKLTTENQGLRELLNISTSYGSGPTIEFKDSAAS